MKLTTRKRLAGPGLRGLLSSRQGALAVSLLCALAATVILVLALGSYRKNVTASVKQETVLVATGLIQKGDSGNVIATQGLFKVTPVLATQAGAGAISDSTYLRGKVAVTDILPGQQLTVADFASTAGISTQLAPGQRAVAVSLDAAHGLTNVMQSGDRVDIYGAYKLDSGRDAGQPDLFFIAPDALVLQAPEAVGSTAPPGNASGTVVFAVSTTDAPKVAWAAENAKLWLFLRPGNATAPFTGITTLDSILGAHPTLSPIPVFGITPTGAPHP